MHLDRIKALTRSCGVHLKGFDAIFNIDESTFDARESGARFSHVGIERRFGPLEPRFHAFESSFIPLAFTSPT